MSTNEMNELNDPFGARRTLEYKGGTASYCSLEALREAGIGHLEKLPVSIKILLECALRTVDEYTVRSSDVEALAAWQPRVEERAEMPFKPARVILQDFTGVPAVVDLAALRSAMARLGGDPSKINPQVRVDLVIDHSVQVDASGFAGALKINADREFERNRERYEFLKWGRDAFDRFRVVPPATGIVHQVNLEYLADCVSLVDGLAVPDTLVGTDSHTTMINGLGVVGWGVGGIEAEAVMLGQPVFMLTPDVIGVKLTGALPEGATATDMVLTVTELLRAHGVVGKFVEFFGPGLDGLTLPDRATIANMAPEYGATMGFFPIDNATLKYLRLTGRSDESIDLVERYCRAQGLWRDDDAPTEYTDVLELDLTSIQTSLAGPKRPQDRVLLTDMKSTFAKAMLNPAGPMAFGYAESDLDRTAAVEGTDYQLAHGSLVIAAITSCTNTSNPSVLITAGLLAKKAVALGLKTKPWVKTSLAPGSRVVTDYLDKGGLSESLDALGFQTVGYGCTTCIGNSGPLPEPISAAIKAGNLVASSVLSGNRNFEGRISPHTKANYLASPPLVVAYAIAGTVDIDLSKSPLGTSTDGAEVFLQDLWPSNSEVNDLMASIVGPESFRKRYASVFDANETWNAIPTSEGDIYPWSETSTYIQEPPFFTEMTTEVQPISGFDEARCLLLLGDSITTDHISPAGAIAPNVPAGEYLIANGVERRSFNSYGSRRGNDRVMTRGTFANVRVRNRLAPGTEGGWTTHFPTGDQISVYEASLRYRAAGTPLVVIGGVDYGMGSSRDWAAKGSLLLGVHAVVATSYERIHRSNLVFMGVLPLQFLEGESAESIGLDGSEFFSVAIGDDVEPLQRLTVKVRRNDGTETSFEAIVRIDSPVEVDYYRNGGILHTVLRQML